jgi:putative oxidoreductase
MAIFDNLGKYRNTGVLIIRIGLGVMMMMHGFPKLSGGVEKWTTIGGTMKHLGIDFFPTAWGFIAAITETFGGFLFVLGLFFRPVSLALLAMMLIATIHHLKSGDGLMGASHPIELAIVFLGLCFIGPGKYSVDKK